MQAALQRSSSRLGVFAACGLVCAVAAVFGRVVGNGWVDFDDYLHLAKNPRFFPVTWQSLRAFWVAPFEKLYVPVSYTVFAGECVASRALVGGTATADLNPALFHGVSVGLHAAAVLVVFAILRRLVGSVWAAAAGALLFAVHPLQVESVAWAFEQRGLLAAVFSLTAILLLLGRFQSGDAPRLLSAEYIAATFLLALALLSKPIAMVAPLLAGALIFHVHKPSLKNVCMVLLPWVALAAATALITRAVQPQQISGTGYPVIARPLIAADALAFYASKLAVPVNLCVQYGRTPPLVWADLSAPLRALCVGVALVAAFTLRRTAQVRLPLVLFLIPLTPVLGLTWFAFQLQSTVADRYMYLAMLGPAAALAMAVDRVLVDARWCRSAVIRITLAIGMTIWLGGLAILAARQTGMWRDTGSLASQACRVAPWTPGPWVMLASYSLEHGDPAKAVACAERALEVEPGNPYAIFNLAEAAFQVADKNTADDMRAKMLESGWENGVLVNGLYQRGVAHLRAGRTKQAEICFAGALHWDPKYPQALINLGVLCSRSGRHERAGELFREAIAVDPQQSAAWVGLGNALCQEGRAGEAVECFNKALAIEPHDTGTIANRAWARLAAGDRAGAVADLAAIKEQEGSPDPSLVRAVMEPEAAGDGQR